MIFGMGGKGLGAFVGRLGTLAAWPCYTSESPCRCCCLVTFLMQLPGHSEPLLAAILVRALLSAWRHQRMLRAESVKARWTDALHIFQVSKGTSHGGAAFQVAIPTFAAPNLPLLKPLDAALSMLAEGELRDHLYSRRCGAR
eukprot:6462263-Amphidinium_carterae.1